MNLKSAILFSVPTLIVAILILQFTCTSEGRKYPFPNCPEPNLPSLEPVPLKNILGPWLTIRSTEAKNAPSLEIDCQCDTYWVNADEQNALPIVNMLYQQRIGGNTQFYQAKSVQMVHMPEGMIERNWTFNMFGMELPVMFVESDEGHSWSIWHTCAQFNATDSYPMWVLMTRSRAIDSKLEQDLIEKIESYSADKNIHLHGVVQSNCF